MKTQMIKKGTGKLNNTDFAYLVSHVISNMTGNVKFPTPVVPLNAISAKVLSFNKLLELMKQGELTKTQKLQLKNLRPSIQADVDRTFAYVLSVSSDIEIQASSGFPLAIEPTPVGDLGAPQNFTARSLSSKSVTLKCKKLKGADSYNYQYTITPNPEVDNWISITHTGSRLTINDLTPGVQYKFRMCGVGAKGAGQWSTANCYVNF